MVRNQNGFTVIEILICVVILATGIIGVFKPLLASVSTIIRLERRIEVSNLLDQKIWEFQTAGREMGSLPGVTTKGMLMGGDSIYHYQTLAEPVSDTNKLYRVDFNVTWNESGLRKSFSQVAYAGLPDHE